MEIAISEVLSEVCRPNSVFEIRFRKDDGSFSEKNGVINRSGRHEDRKKLNRNGLLNCYQPATDKTFSVTIDLIMEFNGMKIQRPE
jgi:hypothetical protein